jgi:hypothetical protein
MGARGWLAMRGVELLAALCVGAVLIGGLAAGVPFLRARIAEVMLYSVACVAAVLVRSALDLMARGLVLLWLAGRAIVRAGPLPQVRAAPR